MPMIRRKPLVEVYKEKYFELTESDLYDDYLYEIKKTEQSFAVESRIDAHSISGPLF